MNKRQFRTVEVRDVADDGRTFTARAVTYNVVDWFETQFAPGVFRRSLEIKLPKLAWAHKWDEVIGRCIDYEDTPYYLDLRCRLSDPDDVPRARQARAQLRDGDLTDVSVGFSTAENGSETRDGILTFTDADLDELSLVLAGAVPGAKVLALRSRHRREQSYISEDAATAILTAFEEATTSGVPRAEALMTALQEIKAASIDVDALDNVDKETDKNGDEEKEVAGDNPENLDTGVDKETPKEGGGGETVEPSVDVPGAKPETGDPVEIVTDPNDSQTLADLDAVLAEADGVLDALDIHVPAT